MSHKVRQGGAKMGDRRKAEEGRGSSKSGRSQLGTRRENSWNTKGTAQRPWKAPQQDVGSGVSTEIRRFKREDGHLRSSVNLGNRTGT